MADDPRPASLRDELTIGECDIRVVLAEAMAEKNYDRAMSVYVVADGIKSIAQKAANLDGKTGREYKLQDSVLGNKGYCRMVHAHGRLYLLIVLAPDWPEADEMARIFFGSVKLKS